MKPSMPDMSDQELDKLFQEAAAGINPKFDPDDWERLASRLDGGGDKTGFAREVSLYSVAALLMLSSFLPGRRQLQTTQTDRPAVIAELHTRNDASKNTSPDGSVSAAADQIEEQAPKAATSAAQRYNSQSRRSSAHSQLNTTTDEVNETVKSLKKQPDGKATSNDQTSQTAPVSAEALQEDDRKLKRQGDDEDHKINRALPVEDHQVATKQTFERKKDPANVILLPERDRTQVVQRKQDEGNNQEDVNTLQKKEEDKTTKGDAQSSAADPGQNDQRVTKAGTRVQTDSSMVSGVIDPTLKLSVMKALPGKDRDQEAVLSGEGSPRNVSSPKTSDSLLTKNDSSKVLVVVQAPVDSTSEQKAVSEEKDSTTRAQWFVKLPVSPDFTSIDYEMPGKPGINIGLMVEFIPKKRLGISAGAIWSRKLYSKENPPTTYGSASRKVRLLDGDCRVLDIPINLTYYWPVGSSRTSFFATAGFSSYIMLEERYEFTVIGNTRDYIYREDINHKNNEWFSIMNLSIGIQRQIGERFWLQAEPFLKAPLSGIGEGKVDLVSSGAFFTLKYQFRK